MGHLSRSLERLGHLPGGGLRSSGMPHEGYANPFMNDGPIFHLNMTDSELTERVTRAIMASDVSSTPLVAETADGPLLRVEAQGKLDSQGDQTCGRRMMAQILGRGYS